jgi:hypothetical protein
MFKTSLYSSRIVSFVSYLSLFTAFIQRVCGEEPGTDTHPETLLKDDCLEKTP